jgi:TPP-dependent indolepyruvate ferredoxin oxidoreductase alpha subunit
MLNLIEQKSFEPQVEKIQDLDQFKIISCYSQKLKALLVVGNRSALLEYKVKDMKGNQLLKREFYKTNSVLVTIKQVHAQNIGETTFIYIGLSTG